MILSLKAALWALWHGKTLEETHFEGGQSWRLRRHHWSDLRAIGRGVLGIDGNPQSLKEGLAGKAMPESGFAGLMERS